MTRTFRNRWLLVAALWIAASLLALWNLESSGKAVAGAQTQAALAAGREFQNAHRDEFGRLGNQLEMLTRPVESPSFGLLYLEQDLAELSRLSGLEDFKFDGKPVVGNAPLPVNVTFSGRLSDTARWLAAVQERMPYLVINAFEATGDPKASKVGVAVSLLFRFEVVTPQA